MENNRQKYRKWTALVLSFCMLAQTLVPGTAFADGTVAEADLQDELSSEEEQQYQEWQLEAERQFYVEQHVTYCQSDEFMDRMDSRFSSELKEAMDHPTSLFAEGAYDLLSDLDSISKFKFHDLSWGQNPYDEILAEIVLLMTDRVLADTCTWSDSGAAVKYGKASLEFVDTLADLIIKVQPDCGLPKPRLKNRLFSFLSDPKKLKSDSPALYEEMSNLLTSCMKTEKAEKLMGIISDKLGFLSSVSGVVTTLDSIQDVVDQITFLYQFYVILGAYDSMSTEVRASLRRMAEGISNEMHRKNMTEALERMEHYFNADSIAAALLEKGAWNLSEMAYEAFAGSVFQPAAIGAMGKYLRLPDGVIRRMMAAMKAYNVGWSISNDLTGNDALVECRELIRANYFFACAAYNTMIDDRNLLLSNPTQENARLFDASYSILSASEQYSLNVYKKYLKTQQKSFVHSLIDVYILGNEDYNREEIGIAEGEAGRWNRARCHSEYGFGGRDSITVKGAVDIACYDYAGNLLFGVEDGAIQEIDDNSGVEQTEDGTVCCFGVQGVYRLELEAEKDGAAEVIFQRENPNLERMEPKEKWSISVKNGDRFRGCLIAMLEGEHNSSFTLTKYAGKAEPMTEKITERMEETAPSHAGGTAAESLNAWLQTVLVPQYGVMATEERNASSPWNPGDLTGLLSGTVRDFDSDGQEELLTVAFESREPEGEDRGTDLILRMYEYDASSGEVLLFAERQEDVCTGYLPDQMGYTQIGVFTYDYQGNTYLAVDHHLFANETISTLVVFQYGGRGMQFDLIVPHTPLREASIVERGGTALDYVCGVGWQMQGEGDYYVRVAYEEPAPLLFCAGTNLWAESDRSSWYSSREYLTFTDIEGTSQAEWQGPMSPQMKEEFVEHYEYLMGSLGLYAEDARLGLKEEDLWPGQEYFENHTTTPQVYRALEGEIAFLSGMYTYNDTKQGMTLLRKDYEGTLDAFR